MSAKSRFWDATTICPGTRSKSALNINAILTISKRAISWEDAEVDADGITIAGMRYRALILEEDPPANAESAVAILEHAGRVIRWQTKMSDTDLIEKIDRLVPLDVRILPEAKDVRVRHVVKAGQDYYILCNEGEEELNVRLDLSAQSERYLLDPETGEQRMLEPDALLQLKRHAIQVVMLYAG